MQFRKSLSNYLVLFLLLCSSAAFAGPVPDTGDPNELPCHPHSYTDLDNGVIKDNVTGLIWQQSTAPGTYTWQQAVDYCDNLTLDGHDDWRLPTILELSTLVDSSIPGPGPTINTTFYTVASTYWSSTADAGSSGNAWIVSFYDGGYVTDNGKTNTSYVRAVRGESSNNNFIENGDGTITDSSTGLRWEKSTGLTTYTWEQAQTYCQNLTLGGKEWRLPTRNELQTLVDYSIPYPGPTINTTFFPDAATYLYWSSTVDAGSSGNAWIVSFYGGDVIYTNKTGNYNVRAVSEGQCGSFTTTTSSTGTTTTSTPIAGTGIIAGMITDAGTGGVIDGALINSSGGISKISSDGFYLMLHPAGVFILSVSATGYLTTVVSCTVTSGESLMQDIALSSVGTTTTTTVGSTTTATTTTTIDGAPTTTTTVSKRRCPIARSLGEDDQNVDRLRDFRDNKLAKSAIGRKVIQIYYTNADSIDAALERSPELRAFTKKVLEVIAPMVEKKYN